MFGKKQGLPYIMAAIYVLLLWQITAWLLRRPVLPMPSAVFTSMDGSFWHAISAHALYSVGRIAVGLLLAAAVGVPLGLVMGYFPRADALLSPLTYLLYPIPKIALLPVVMLLIGMREGSKVFMIFLIVVFQVIVAARDAVRSIPVETFYALTSLGATQLQIFREIILPASLPGLFTSLRIGLGTAFSILFFTETFGTEYGMGFFIMDAWMRVNYLEMYAGIMVLSLLGLLLFLAVDRMDRWWGSGRVYK